MKLKDVYELYGNTYSIEVYGKPLDEPTIPFTHIPRDKDILMNCDVIDWKKEDKEFKEFGISFDNMKPTESKYLKGIIQVYVKESKHEQQD
jgi:hypothetical protein